MRQNDGSSSVPAGSKTMRTPSYAVSLSGSTQWFAKQAHPPGAALCWEGVPGLATKWAESSGLSLRLKKGH